ncbi:LysR family transcriptional regulator [Paenirhodobacter populi]|uniref:LysR family transcriptional regulator n=1 Tax=Paenirhodobacter populi TaxID=2306993 RepID=A0A443JR51_9RHOB|nr:LysR family transcriptional regulator [Sinirhodobacter populi]RWR22990.1 LysR family transcriptional regulator [Sinirhodobacter populi]
MNSFGALEAFVHSAETRSFTEAGHRLGISPSAVGKAVARLEEELGARLFHRSTRAITLTAEGGQFLDRCYRIFAEYDEAKRELTHASSKPQGKMRVGLPQLGIYLMPHLIAFQQQFPEIELELDFSDRIVNLIEEGFDAVMRIGELNDSRLTMRRLDGYRHRLVAAPAYLAHHGTPHRPAELMDHACLRYRYPTTGKLAPWPLHTRGRPLNIDPPQSSVTNTMDSLLGLAQAGLGIALLPDFIVSDAIAAGRLTLVLDTYVQDQRDFCILWPSSRHTAPKIKAFIDFMASRLGAAGTLRG